MRELEVLLGLVLAAVILAAFARRVGAPYPVFLALGGALIAFLPGAPSFTLPPELVLALFIAPVLRERGISYVVGGIASVDLVRAVDLLGEHFGIRTLLLEGGGHINGAFLEAGLIDEVSLLVAPGIDGRHGIPAVFDGLSPRSEEHTSELQSPCNLVCRLLL